jgi:hypothetical protein
MNAYDGWTRTSEADVCIVKDEISPEWLGDYSVKKKLAPPSGAPAFNESIKSGVGLRVTVLFRECG